MAGKKTSGKLGNRNPWLRLFGFIFLFLSVFGFLGTFGISRLGIALSSFLRLVLGQFAWTGPYLFLGLAFYLWVSSLDEHSSKTAAAKREHPDRNEAESNRSNRLNRSRLFGKRKSHGQGRSKANERRRHSQWDVNWEQDSVTKDNIRMPLPPTKLVSLKGFNQYFASEAWSDVAPAPQPTIGELGNDFSTYFGEGEASYKSPVQLTSLRGFRTYFNVDEWTMSDREERTEAETRREEPLYPGQIASLRERVEDRKRVAETNFQATQPGKELQPTELRYEMGTTENRPEMKAAELRYEMEAAEPDDELGAERLSGELEGVKPPVKSQVSYEKAAIKLSYKVESGQPLERQRQTWKLPDYELLDPHFEAAIFQETDTQNALEGVLQDFGVKAKVIRVARGPVITRYELAPAPGVKISRIVNLADDIALALAARDVRIEAPIPGKAAIGIEIPNKQPRAVSFREVLDTSAYRQNPSRLKAALGKDIGNQPIVGDLSKMPHLLVAGATGSGKSVCITSLINSLLFNAKPDEVRFLLIDPKMVELNLYNGIPHLLAPVVTDPQKAAVALKWIVKEMETRYELFAAAGVRDIARYNQAKLTAEGGTTGTLPYIVVIIDELADLMLVAAGDVEEAICRLAQMARAAGIHLVIATQRPSVDVITGVIKANIPSRISFAVSSQIDSRTILDSVGAEKLIGKGDMLYSPLGVSKPIRVQGCLVTDEEVERIIQHWKAQGKPEYLDPESLFAETGKKGDENSIMEDDLFVDAGRLLINTGMGSVTFLQRRMKLGYARAARLMDMLEEQGIVGPYEGSKPRLILISLEEFEERFG